jgi:hypothetical protein
MMRRSYSRAKELNSYKAVELLFPTAVGGAVMWAASYRDWIWNNHGVFGILVVGLLGAAVSSLALHASGLGIRAWRWGPLRSYEPLSAPKPFPITDWDRPLQQWFRVYFQNETVLLDGYEFIECTFENVTFEYQGTKPFRFTGKTGGNSRKLTSDNVIVGQTLTLVKFFRPDFDVDCEIFKTGTRPSSQPALPADQTSRTVTVPP